MEKEELMKQEYFSDGLEDSFQANLDKFWISFTAWYKQQSIINEFFKSEFVIYDNWDGGLYDININFDEEYKITYGTSFPRFALELPNIEFSVVRDFVEIMYERWIKNEKHYEFTIILNNRLSRFLLPFKLSSGKLVKKGYRTTEPNPIILNKRMFDRKIIFSEQMILSNELLDKKTALDYIIDALQFLISIQDATNKEKKYSEAAGAVIEDSNSKTFVVIRREIEEIMKISNEYFDIRHNEYLNKAKEKREAIDDSQFIEYLYNRAYGLLYLLRLKADKMKLIAQDN